MIYSGEAVDVLNGNDGPEIQIAGRYDGEWVAGAGSVLTVEQARIVYRELGEALAAIAPTAPAWVLDASDEPEVWTLTGGRNDHGAALYRSPAKEDDTRPSTTLRDIDDAWGIAEEGPEVRVP